MDPRESPQTWILWVYRHQASRFSPVQTLYFRFQQSWDTFKKMVIGTNQMVLISSLSYIFLCFRVIYALWETNLNWDPAETWWCPSFLGSCSLLHGPCTLRNSLGHLPPLLPLHYLQVCYGIFFSIVSSFLISSFSFFSFLLLFLHIHLNNTLLPPTA